MGFRFIIDFYFFHPSLHLQQQKCSYFSILSLINEHIYTLLHPVKHRNFQVACRHNGIQDKGYRTISGEMWCHLI